MAYIEGTTLEEWIEAGRRTEHEVAALARQVLGGLMAVHRVGVLHRDIKPANIVVTRDQQVCLVDFGIARIVGESGVTATGLLLGTVEYMAPERVNDHAQSPAADLWSFGVTFLHALEGYSPFRRGSVPATFFAILSDPLPAARRPGPLYDALTDRASRGPRPPPRRPRPGGPAGRDPRPARPETGCPEAGCPEAAPPRDDPPRNHASRSDHPEADRSRPGEAAAAKRAAGPGDRPLRADGTAPSGPGARRRGGAPARPRRPRR